MSVGKLRLAWENQEVENQTGKIGRSTQTWTSNEMCGQAEKKMWADQEVWKQITTLQSSRHFKNIFFTDLVINLEAVPIRRRVNCLL